MALFQEPKAWLMWNFSTEVLTETQVCKWIKILQSYLEQQQFSIQAGGFLSHWEILKV